MSIFNLFASIQRRVRRYLRQRTLPMSVDEAENKREFFAKVYFLCSFSAFSYLTYSVYHHKMKNYDSTVSSAETAIETFKLDGKVRIMKFEGFTKVQDYYYEREGNEKNKETENQNLDPELVADAVPNNELLEEIKL